MKVVRKHQMDVFIILPAKHRIVAVQLARKERHAFVLHGWTVEGDEFEMEEIGRFDELRQNHFAVVCGIGRVISWGSLFVGKKNETRVLDAIALRGGGGEQYALR